MIFGNKNLKIATDFLQENKDGLRNFLEFFKNYDNDSLQSVLDILKTSHGSINGIIGSLAKIDDDLKKSEIDKLKTAIDSINSILRNRELSNDIVSRMVQNVEISATSFYARLSENKSSKLIIKKLITSVPKVHEILRNDKAIFIEAGSTLSYVALSLIDRAFQIRQQLPHITTEDILTTIEPLAISTNNPLIYMISLYEHHIDPTLLQGKPRNHYGATYGDPKSADSCNTDEVNNFFNKYEIDTMFTTASVLDINYGTHVSSEPNKIMKQTCNDFIKSKKTNTIKDIFVIASEHINNDIQEKRVNNDCKLIFSENKKNAKDLSPRELNAIRNKFSEYLFNNDVTIISGSSNVGKCYETTQQFLKAHEDLNCLKVEMFPNDQPHDEGCISVIYNKKFAWKR